MWDIPLSKITVQYAEVSIQVYLVKYVQVMSTDETIAQHCVGHNVSNSRALH